MKSKPKKPRASQAEPTNAKAAIRQSNCPADICAIDEAVDALHRVTATVNTGTASDIRRVFFIEVADWRKIQNVLEGLSLRARGFNDFPNANDVRNAWARFDSAWYDLIVGMMNRFYTETKIIADVKKGVEEFFADIDMERDIWEWQPQSIEEHYKAIRLRVEKLEGAAANGVAEIAKHESEKPAAYTQTTPQSKGASAATNTKSRSPAISIDKPMQDFIYKKWEEFKTGDLDGELRRAGGKRTYGEFLEKHGTDKRDGTNKSILDALGVDKAQAEKDLEKLIHNCNRRK